MKNKSSYFTNFAALTGQFPYCSLPFRLDSYRGCGFACSYCFARVRGGNVPSQKILAADVRKFRHLMNSAHSRKSSTSIMGQLIQNKTPFHFGGMSDPFQNVEKKWNITKGFLEVLSSYGYPVIISTKGTMLTRDCYLELFQKMPVIVQFSLSSIHDKVSGSIEPHTSRPSQILRAMADLSKANVIVTCRWQPYVPSLGQSPTEFMQAMAAIGAKHVAFEHLKVPVERDFQFSDAAAARLISRERDSYLARGAYRDGREFVLPPQEKYHALLDALKACHKHGMSFGAADNEFQYLSDGEACCSGVDQFAGFENVLRFNIACAIRRSRNKLISLETIRREWRPSGSVDRFLNSRTRISRRLGVEGSIEDHVRYRWNSIVAPGNPTSFFGVEPTNEMDDFGDRIFSWNEKAKNLTKSIDL